MKISTKIQPALAGLTPAVSVRRRSPDLAETAGRRSPRRTWETCGRARAAAGRPQRRPRGQAHRSDRSGLPALQRADRRRTAAGERTVPTRRVADRLRFAAGGRGAGLRAAVGRADSAVGLHAPAGAGPVAAVVAGVRRPHGPLSAGHGRAAHPEAGDRRRGGNVRAAVRPVHAGPAPAGQRKSCAAPSATTSASTRTSPWSGSATLPAAATNRSAGISS